MRRAALTKVEPSITPITSALGILGIPGLTAYFGLLEVGQLKIGERVLVFGAGGAVGSAVGQIAKIKKCHVVGVAATQQKVDYIVNELGFDDAFNYNTVADYNAKLQEVCPNGIDLYFDNTGSQVTDAVFLNINVNERMAICGQISQYNAIDTQIGPRLLWHLIAKRARVEGLLVRDFEIDTPRGSNRWENGYGALCSNTGRQSRTVWKTLKKRS